jgi:hypothetical protein
LRLSPRSNQVIHFSMEQEVSTTMDGAAFAVHGRTRAALTHTIGERGGGGRFASTIASENLSMEMTLNGTINAVARTYDAGGAVVELRPPADMDPAIAGFVKGMVGTLFGSRAAGATLEVGETATLPFTGGMPIPNTAGLRMISPATRG